MATPVVPQSTLVLTKAVDAAIRKYFVDEYKENEPMIEKVFTVQNQENETDEYSGFTGLSGTFSEITQGAKYPEDTSMATYNTNFTVSKRGVTEPITWESGKWSRSSDLTNSGKKLAKAAKQDVGKQAGSVLTGGFTTTVATVNAYGDGKNLFSIAHLRADGGTSWSNCSASSIKLTESGLWTGIIALQNQLNDRGETLDIDATRLIVPKGSENFKTATILLDSEKRPSTADNDMNIYNGLLELVGWRYLNAATTGTAADNGKWYLQDGGTTNLLWQWGEKPSVQKDESVGFLNDVVYYKIRYERARGWISPRGIWGSYGDGSTTISV
jgi:hypothetical protein